MDQHLTIAEAKAFTGKSESTIKRLLREITAKPGHPDRSGILPVADDLKRLKAAGEPYAWKIDRHLLLRRFPQETTPEEGTDKLATPTAAGSSNDTVIQILQEQLRSKDEQIRTLEKQLDRKDEQIANSNDRLRESNVLMRELQQRLAIAAPATTSPLPVVDPKPTAQKTAKETVSAKRKKPSSASAPKRGILARLFWRR